MSNGMSLDVTTGTSTNTTSLYIVVVAATTYKLIDLVVVVSEVVVNFLAPILRLDGAYNRCKLETSVM